MHSSLTRPRRERRRRLVAAATLAAALAGPAATAHADSIVFIKDSNIWLAQPDGSGQYQVTTDGTSDHPYRSPTQADDGTIAAGHLNEIVRLKQNGTVLNRMDPPPLKNTVSHPVDGAPVDVAISPDGSRIVYTLVTYTCPVAGPECAARPATAVTPADRLTPVGNAYTSQSSWVTNSRLLTFAGFLHQVNTFDVGQQEDVHWFDDQELAGQGNSTDLSDGEANRQGTYVAAIRGYGNDRTVMWLPIRGDVAAGSRAAGTLALPTLDGGCITGAVADLSGPTWSPDGRSLAWREAGGIQVWDDAGSCGGGSRMVIPGGSEPDWGPAAVSPGPRPGTGGGTTTPPPGGGPGGPSGPSGPGGPDAGGPDKSGGKPPAVKAKLTLGKSVRLAAALKGGIALRLTGAAKGRRTVTATSGGRKVASGMAVVPASGRATVRLRFTKAARTTLAARKSLVLRVTGVGATLTLTVKR
ncbi:hypothetical protein [Paraconexibacter sp. AEG42_29]